MLIRLLKFFEDDLPAILMAVSVLVVSADVVMRYFFNHPIQGAAEVALISFVWLIFLASAGAMRRGRHVSIEVLVENFSPRVKAVVDVFVQLLMVAVFVTLVVAATLHLLNDRFTFLPATGLSKSWLTLAIPISSAMMLLHSSVDMVRAVRGVATGRYERHTEPLEDDSPMDATVDIHDRKVN